MFSEERLPYYETDLEDLDTCIGVVHVPTFEEQARETELAAIEMGVRPFNILARYRTSNGERVRTVEDCAGLSDADLYLAVRQALGENVSWQTFYRDLGACGEARESCREVWQSAIYRDMRAAGTDPGE